VGEGRVSARGMPGEKELGCTRGEKFAGKRLGSSSTYSNDHPEKNVIFWNLICQDTFHNHFFQNKKEQLQSSAFI